MSPKGYIPWQDGIGKTDQFANFCRPVGFSKNFLFQGPERGLCNQPAPIEGSTPLTEHPFIVLQNSFVTALVSHSDEEKMSLYFGTMDGNLKKVCDRILYRYRHVPEGIVIASSFYLSQSHTSTPLEFLSNW